MSLTREQRQLIAEGKRRCTTCLEVKAAKEFYACGGMCKPCRNAYKQRWKSGLDEEQRRSYMLRDKYNIEQSDYKALLRAQNGRCGICGTEDPGGRWGLSFHVDHDHACCPGKKSCGECVRGLLCSSCNTGVGNFRDDPNRLIAAAAYLVQRQDVLSTFTKEKALMPTVRTTMQPDREIEVDAAEYAQLKAEGLLIEDAPAPETPAASAPPATKKTSGATGSKES
jgi:hypothetical protein